MVEFENKILDSKILIVDDDVALGMMLEETLRENDYKTVRYISDPRQTETVYKQFQPDLVMLDLRMPHVDGFQVLDRIKQLEPVYVPVLVLTGETDEDISLRALNAGAADFLNKPYKVSEILARIRNLLKVRQLQKELLNKTDFLQDKMEDRTVQLRQAVQDLDRMHHEVKEAYIETIYRLTRATEYKDGETANHVRRLSLYSAAFARSIGMNEANVDLLLYASPMHDIGKIGIPDKILFKGGALNDEEWKIMKQHTTIGHEILKDSKAPVLKLGALIALNHHERWDGSGYPNGIKGEKIPMEARIVQLVDVYDALRSKRHYKEAFDHEKTCKIIFAGDGRVMPHHFDPVLLEAFRKIEKEIRDIFEQNSN